MISINILIIIIEVIAGAVLAFLYIKSRIPKETIEQQTELIATLKDRLDMLERSDSTNQKAISVLEGQIRVYKDIPLRDIAKSLEALEALPKKIEEMQERRDNAIISFFTTQNDNNLNNALQGGIQP